MVNKLFIPAFSIALLLPLIIAHAQKVNYLLGIPSDVHVGKVQSLSEGHACISLVTWPHADPGALLHLLFFALLTRKCKYISVCIYAYILQMRFTSTFRNRLTFNKVTANCEEAYLL